MDLLTLKYFVALAREQHMTKTAQKLLISVPSLSATISRLEKELGVPLFDRVGRKITLNASGEVFLKYISQGLQSIEEGVARIEEIKNSQTYSISVGITSLSFYFDFLESFKQRFPSVKISHSIVKPEETDKYAHLFQYDFYIGVLNDIDTKQFDYIQIIPPQQTVALLSADHPLAGKKAVYMDELRNEVFISPGDSFPSAHKFIYDLCGAAGFEPKQVITTDLYYRVQAISRNMGIGLSTPRGYRDNAMSCGDIVYVPIADASVFRENIIAWRRNMTLGKHEKAFLSYAKEYFASQREK